MGKVEKHLSRLAMPKNWQIQRKGIKWVARPLPGAHPINRGFPLVVLFRDILKIAKTSKEVKSFVFNKQVLVDGVRRRNIKQIVGLFDIISLPILNKDYIVLLNTKNKFIVKEIPKEFAKFKLCRVKGKSSVKKQIQLNLYDGKNILIDKGDYKIGDTLVIELGSQKILDSLKLIKGQTAYLIGGKHIGEIGKIQDIQSDKIILQGEDKKIFEAPKNYVYVVGKDKPIIPLK